jgi:hypothetical protein
MHLCEMYISVRPSVHLFTLYHVLRSTKRDVGPIDSYYFQHMAKGHALYIAAITVSKWDHWR